MPERRSARGAGAALFFLVAPGGVVGLMPYLLSRWRVDHQLPSVARLVGAGLIAAGAVSVVESFVRFVVRGHGTPAPIAPPRHLVVSGQYRLVRNPMYVGLVFVALGQAVWFGSVGLAAYAALLFVAFHLRVVGYEEPQLLRLFGNDFAAYCERVPRWFPPLKPWKARNRL